MATWAIGDVQGCFDELQELLRRAEFEPSRDRLWFVGDLVNRGPKSLEVLRFVRGLGERAVTVLGNHDLHLVCHAAGLWEARADDTLEEVLAAPDGEDLVAWLRGRPMLHAEGGFAMVHAGLLPQWSIDKALALAREVEAALRAPDYRDFLANMYGGKPSGWRESLTGWDRLRGIVNAMTRMRYCTTQGEMEFHTTGVEAPPGYAAWFDQRPSDEVTAIVCGHWSQLGLCLRERLLAIDTGCIWGRELTALRLEDRKMVQVPCSGSRAPTAGIKHRSVT